MKTSLILAIMLLAIAASQSVFAQTGETSSTVNLNHFTIQVSYPAEVLPGDSITIHVQAKAKSSFNLVSLTIQVYYADGSALHQVTSATLASNSYMSNGGSVNKDVQLTVPSNMPRTALVAVFSENVRVAYYDYYYYPAVYYWNYSYPYWYYDYYYYYPAVSYYTSADDEVGPLSYVKATTPEYVSLQAEYDKLQQNLQQVQAENQKLQQDLAAAQNTISQRDAQIADLNQQLDSTKTTNTALGIAVLALVAVAVIVAVLALRRGRSKEDPEPVPKTSPTPRKESEA